jgi:hypothetical protein
MLSVSAANGAFSKISLSTTTLSCFLSNRLQAPKEMDTTNNPGKTLLNFIPQTYLKNQNMQSLYLLTLKSYVASFSQ